jgi:hypothetical protein
MILALPGHIRTEMPGIHKRRARLDTYLPVSAAAEFFGESYGLTLNLI